MSGWREESDETIHLVSELLDEVYRLRKAMAYEALKTQEVLKLKTLPETARRYIRTQLLRFIGAANGKASLIYSYSAVNREMWDRALQEAGAEPSLTRAQFEKSVGLRND